MLRLYTDNKVFYNLSLLFTLAGGLLLALTNKGEAEIFINQYNHPIADEIFFYITYLGDGILISLIIFFMFLRKVYYGVLGAVIFSISSLLTQVMKRTIFAEFPRPAKFFEPSLGLRFVENLEIHHWNSFPSGHSSGAFTIFLLLSLISRKPAVQAICFFAAMAAAFSRMYLLQHFLMDIYGGALIGISITSFIYYLIEYKSSLSTNKILEKPLVDLFQSKNN